MSLTSRARGLAREKENKSLIGVLLTLSPDGSQVENFESWLSSIQHAEAIVDKEFPSALSADTTRISNSFMHA